MSEKIKTYSTLGLAFLIVIAVVLWFHGCKKDEPKTYENAKAAIDASKNALQLKEFELERLRSERHDLRKLADSLFRETKKTPKLTSLVPKRTEIKDHPHVETNDSNTIFQNHYYDSVQATIARREAIMDSLETWYWQAVNILEQEKIAQSQKDSINKALVVHLESAMDSLHKQKNLSYWKGVKHGFVGGVAVGAVTGAIVR
jgi:chromosome segregation ATPase